jgi:hypothetical protein
MNLADLREKAAIAARLTKTARAVLRKSPVLALATAFAAGWLAGVVTRVFERRSE